MEGVSLIFHLLFIVLFSGVFADIGDLSEQIAVDLDELGLPGKCLDAGDGPIAELDYRYADRKFAVSCEYLFKDAIPGNEDAEKIAERDVGQLWYLDSKREDLYIVPPSVRLDPVTEPITDIYPKISYHNITGMLKERLRTIYQLFHEECDEKNMHYSTFYGSVPYTYNLEIDNIILKVSFKNHVFDLGEQLITKLNTPKTCHLKYDGKDDNFSCSDIPIDEEMSWYVRHYQEAPDDASKEFNAVVPFIKLAELRTHMLRLSSLVVSTGPTVQEGEVTILDRRYLKASSTLLTCSDFKKEALSKIKALVGAKSDKKGRKMKLFATKKDLHVSQNCFIRENIDPSQYAFPMPNDEDVDYSIDFVSGSEFKKQLEGKKRSCADKRCNVKTFKWEQLARPFDITVREHCEKNVYLLNNVEALVEDKENETLKVSTLTGILFDGDTNQFVGGNKRIVAVAIMHS